MPLDGLGGVEAAPVEGVVLGGLPGAGGGARHAVARDEAVGELRVDEVPPRADAKDLRALLGDEAARLPQGLGDAPVGEVLADEPGDHASPAVGPVEVAGRQHEAPVRVAGGAVDLRVAPVGGVVALGGSEGVLRVLRPGAHVGARGVGDELEGPAVGCEAGRVVGGVEEVVDPRVVLDDASGVGVEVLGVGAAGGECLPAVLVVDEVAGDGEVPRHAGPGLLASFEEVVQADLVSVGPRDDVAHPVRGRPEEDVASHGHSLVINRLTMRLHTRPHLGQAIDHMLSGSVSRAAGTRPPVAHPGGHTCGWVRRRGAEPTREHRALPRHRAQSRAVSTTSSHASGSGATPLKTPSAPSSKPVKTPPPSRRVKSWPAYRWVGST